MNFFKKWEIYFLSDSANGPESPCRREDSSRIFFQESAYWIRTNSMAVDVNASPTMMYIVQSNMYVVFSVKRKWKSRISNL